MAVQITLLSETILVIKVYALIVKTERESMFESLLLLLQQYDGTMFVGGDFNCPLSRDWTVGLYRHADDTILWCCDGFSVEQGSVMFLMVTWISPKKRELYRHFRRRLILISTLCRALVRQARDWIGGM